MLRLRGRPAQVSAVDAATFEVADGEVFGLLGPNGAGKTTIFRMLSTMILPDGGTATVGGYDIVADAAAVPCGKRRCSASRSVR
jgi:ABC-2 type transport system ATP-binding protein